MTLKKPICISLLAICLAFMLLLALTSQRGLIFLLRIQDDHPLNLWTETLIDVAEYRYSDVPEFQRIIALYHYARYKQEGDKAFDSLSRVIATKADSETRVFPLLRRAEMWGRLERWNEALKDLTEAKVLMTELEARGVNYMDGYDSEGIQRRIDWVLKKQAAQEATK